MPGRSGRPGAGPARKGRGRRPKDTEEIAKERMAILVAEAEAAVRAGRGDRARRYVDLARQIGMRHNVPMAREWRRWVCQGCGTYLVPGRNASLRTRPGRTVVHCLDCGTVKRQGHGAGRRRAGARA